MTALLRRHYGEEAGNGAAYAFIPQVRNDAGFSASRTIDAVAMSLWPSRGLRLTAHEIKVARADWVKEMRDPSKAEAFQPFVDYFYLVVSDESIVRPGELPETWGLMAPRARGLGVIVQAPLNENVQTMTRGMLAALLRQAGVQAMRPPEDIEAARYAGFREGQELGESMSKSRIESLSETIKDLRAQELEFKRRCGVNYGTLRGRDDAFYAAVKSALDGERDVEHLRDRLRRIGDDAKVLAGQADRIMGEHFPDGSP